MLRGYGGKKNRKRRRKKIMQYQMRNLECQIFSINQTNSLINERSSSRHFFAPKNFCSRAGVSIKSLSLSHFFSCVGKTFFCSITMRIFRPFLSFPIWNSSISSSVTFAQCIEITKSLKFTTLHTYSYRAFFLSEFPFCQKKLENSNETLFVHFETLCSSVVSLDIFFMCGYFS